MHQFAGPVALVLAGLWLAYLVPYKLRHRQQLLESRADDRYSEALRVVAVTRRVRHVVRAAGDRAHAGTTGLLTPGSGLLAVAGSRTGGETVDRPHATPERVTAEAARRAATLRASRAALVARRAAAARRRAVLAIVLLVATAAGWAAFGLVPAASLLLGLVPTVLLGGVLVAGRRAVVAGKRNDERLAQQIAQSEELAANPRSGATVVVPGGKRVRAARPATAVTEAVPAPGASPAVAAAPSSSPSPAVAPARPARIASVPTPRVTGRAVHPSDASTEVFTAIVADRGEKGATAPRHATGAVPAVREPEPAAPAAGDDEQWSPMPVPLPTYATKPAAPHREPVPLGEVEGSTSARPAPAASTEPATVADDGSLTPEAPTEASASIDLNAVLAKRRASGQ